MFQPPRNKTEVLKPVTFIAPARVLASVVDQDSYTGFVGVQDKVSTCNWLRECVCNDGCSLLDV